MPTHRPKLHATQRADEVTVPPAPEDWPIEPEDAVGPCWRSGGGAFTDADQEVIRRYVEVWERRTVLQHNVADIEGFTVRNASGNLVVNPSLKSLENAGAGAAGARSLARVEPERSGAAGLYVVGRTDRFDDFFVSVPNRFGAGLPTRRREDDACPGCHISPATMRSVRPTP